MLYSITRWLPDPNYTSSNPAIQNAQQSGSSSTTSNVGQAESKMRSVIAKMFANPGQIQLIVTSEVTGIDPQPKASPNPHTHTNEDLLVTLIFPAKLIFPGSSYALSDAPKGQRIKRMIVKVRMPVERPYFK